MSAKENEKKDEKEMLDSKTQEIQIVESEKGETVDKKQEETIEYPEQQNCCVEQNSLISYAI